MNTDIIFESISQKITLTPEERTFFDSLLVIKTVKQGEMVVKAGEPVRYLIFPNAGYLMTYFTDKDGDDHVIQFAGSGWWTGDLYSMEQNVPSAYSTRALTESEIIILPKIALDHLLEKNVKFERYFRMTFQHGLMRLQQRLVQMHANSAEERYLAFCDRFPAIEQFIAQKYIASYLGITPEFLSKVRRNLAS